MTGRPEYRRQKAARGLAARHPLALLAVSVAMVMAALVVENPLALVILVGLNLLTLWAAGRLPDRNAHAPGHPARDCRPSIGYAGSE